MRAGACTVQQTLTSEAASVLKHSLGLARRRGHAQVTPLHVAATLLSPSPRASLLKRACLKSQPHHHHQHHQTHQTNPSHPLQYCRALELCFNVALNRLPTTPGPLLHGQPSLSNALIAALKRAQAHQRRGCIEQQQQQQPLLAIKVELEQLILSILDDPSVSRVMREAGFSSTAVKNNLEDSSSASSVFQCYSTTFSGGGGGVYSSPCSPSRPSETQFREVINKNNPNSFWQTHLLTYNSESNPLLFSPQKKLNLLGLTDSAPVVKEDIKLVFEVLLRKKRRNTVIIGDSVSITEALVAELMDRIEKGDVPYDELKSVHFIKFQFSSVPLRFMRREEVELNLSDLKRKVDSLIASGGGKGGVIIYTGDLKWTVEDTKTVVASDDYNYIYNPVDHLVADIGRLLSEYSNSNTKVWLMATANYQTYMRCQMKQPSLEIQWSLQAVSVPSGGLGLSLHGHASTTSVHESRISSFSQNPTKVLLETKAFSGKEEQDNYKLTCCAECTSKYEKEAHGLIKSGQHHKPSLYLSSNCDTKDMDKASSSPLPYWLQSHAKEEVHKDELVELRRKWNRLCHSQHQQGRHNNQNLALEGSLLINNQSLSAKSYNYTSSSSSASASSAAYPWWPNRNNIFPDSNSISFAHSHLKPSSHTASSLPHFRRQNSCHIEFSFGNERNNKHQQSLEPNLDCLKNTQGKEVKITLALGNCQFSDTGKLAERKGDICKQLQENLPWQSENIPSIVEALIESKQANAKETTWLLIHGNDFIGKRRLARGIAESVLGSADLFLHMNMRERDGKRRMSLCSGTLERALTDHEKIVVLVEDVDFADTQFLKFLSDGFETGKFGESSKTEEEKSFGQAIIILTKGDSDSTCYGDAEEDLNFVTQIKLEVSETNPNSEDNKRKAEWDLSNKAKSPRIDEKEKAYSISTTENGKAKKEFTRQSSSNTLDLNIKADDNDDDDESEEAKLARDFSPISSDLTRETGNDLHNPHGFLELIKNRFVFNRDSTHDRLIKEMVLSKIKECFEEVCGQSDLGCLFGGVEEKLIEELLVGSGFFLNCLFEKWLKDVFQTSLKTVKIGGKENKVRVRVCLGRKGGESSNGFMGSSLPKKIQVSFIG